MAGGGVGGCGRGTETLLGNDMLKVIRSRSKNGQSTGQHMLIDMLGPCLRSTHWFKKKKKKVSGSAPPC